MNRFIGTKQLNAKPMTRGDYNDFRGWKLPEDEDGNDEGYLVEYLDGGKPNTEEYENYISWSPKDVFENSYRAIDGLTFGQAVEAIKSGLPVSRRGWNGANMFAYLVPENSYPAQTGVAKSFFGESAMVPYRQYLALKTAQGDVATWAPSGSDALADDWFVYGEDEK